MSSASINYEGAQVTPTPFQDYGLERLIRRSKTLAAVIGELGLIQAAKVVYDSEFHHPVRESELIYKNHQVFRQPATVTTARSDISTLIEIVRKQVYQMPNKIDERIAGRQIVDLGANVGLSAAFFASRYPKSSVLAIEPHSRNYYYLETNALAYDGQISTANSALAPRVGRVDMVMPAGISQNNHAGYRFVPAEQGDIETEAYNHSITPSEILPFAKDGIGLLKIDIEGAEKTLFESGVMDPLLGTTEVMAIETHDRYMPGSALAVAEAARRSGMALYSNNGHTELYAKI